MATHMTQPINTEVRITPFSQRLFQFNTDDSRLYLSKATNGLLIPYLYGYREPKRIPSSEDEFGIKLKYNDRLDCIIDGLNNDAELLGNILTVNVKPGQCIVDTTLIIFPNECEVSIDITSIKPTSNKIRVLLSVNFQWLETLYDQPPKIRLTLIDPNDPTNYGPDVWETRLDRLIISYYDIDLDTREVINICPTPSMNYDFNFINVKNVPYEVAPPIQFLNNFNEYCKLTYLRKYVIWTQPCINPERMIENEITFPMMFYSSEQYPIIGFSYDIIYDPSLLTSPGFVVNNYIVQLGKTVDVYVDKDSEGNETGLIRIQIGENSANLTLLPNVKIGDITFYFTKNSPIGTEIQLTVTNIKVSYNNGTGGTMQFISREPATIENRVQVPVRTYDFQPPDINFGKVTLIPNLRFMFNLNGMFQELILIDSIIDELTENRFHVINLNLKCYLDDDNNFIIEGLDRNLTFTDPIIESANDDINCLYFWEQSTGSEIFWTISNPSYYWNLTAGDIINFKFDGKDEQSFIINESDVNFLISNQNNWVIMPSLDCQIFEAKYTIDPITALNKISFRISEEYEDDYVIKDCNIKIIDGNGYTNHSSIVHDYRSEEHVYDLNGIDLTGNDEMGLDQITIKPKNENEIIINMTDDIISVLKNTDYGCRDQNIQLWIDKVTNTLHLTPVFYNTTFESSTLTDNYLNIHEPDENEYPCIWFIDNFISTRPVGDTEFIKDPNLIYTDCWQLGDFNNYSSGERDFFVEYNLKDHFMNFDIQVQVTENNLVINPMGIEILSDEEKIKIWMPESFIFKQPMKQLKITLVG